MDGPWAHSANGSERRHPLGDHLREVARLGKQFAEHFEGGALAWWLGLLHDVGKAACVWQARLLQVEGTDERVGLDHKRLGAQLALERGLSKFAMAIQGHHGGLTSPSDMKRWLKASSCEEKAAQEDALGAVREMLQELSGAERVIFPDSWLKDPCVAEMGLRLTFSALCDADHLDTAAHFAGLPEAYIRPPADFACLWQRFEFSRKAMLDSRKSRFPGRGRMDHIREDVYRACVDAASKKPSKKQGVFRLAAPTGSGKTISAGAFAVRHAALHNKRRVIVAVPFLTITEQNAGVYRTLLDGPDGDAVVLEHHSGVDFDQPKQGRARLAAENWDAPFVVTTMVRLFESLFDRRPAAMRRLHRLAGSVIVLDEIQSLPHALLVPILDALRVLVDHFGVTVLLSSATQPDFWRLSPFRSLEATDIVVDAQGLARRLHRVDFEWRTDPSPGLEEIAREAAESAERQTMVVVNTTADAKRVFDVWRSIAPGEAVWHLSTRMCGAHRRRVLHDVRTRLRCGQPVLLVSTQLIEAGVDVDFQVVYRVLAPADSLLQAAGRANREGNLPRPGRVIIVDPQDAGQPPGYRTLIDCTRLHFGPGRNPDDLDALRAYYGSIYGALNLEHPDHVGMRIQEARMGLDFRSVTDGPLDAASGKRDRRYAFRMISESGVTVVTPGGAADEAEREGLEALVEKIRTAPRPDCVDIRSLQPYTTSLHTSALRRPGVIAQLRPIIGFPSDPAAPAEWNGVLAEWIGSYQKETGIDLDPGTERFVV